MKIRNAMMAVMVLFMLILLASNAQAADSLAPQQDQDKVSLTTAEKVNLLIKLVTETKKLPGKSELQSYSTWKLVDDYNIFTAKVKAKVKGNTTTYTITLERPVDESLPKSIIIQRAWYEKKNNVSIPKAIWVKDEYNNGTCDFHSNDVKGEKAEFESGAEYGREKEVEAQTAFLAVIEELITVYQGV